MKPRVRWGGRRGSRGRLRLLQLAAFFSSFDRFVVGQMLVTIAATAFGASLAETTATASLYYLLYGGMQPVWGMHPERLGRVALDFHSVSVLVLFVAVFFIATMPRAGKVQEGPRTGSVRPLLRTSTIVEGI